jgi:hypothetical protein
MMRVTFCHVFAWREPETGTSCHVDEQKVLHVLDPEEPCEVQNFLVPDDTQVEPGDWWNGDVEAPLFAKEMFNGLGAPWSAEPVGMGQAAEAEGGQDE